MFIPSLCGGLGNNMFQLSSIMSLSLEYGHEFGLENIPLPPSNHSNRDYTKSIFKNFNKYVGNYDIKNMIIKKENSIGGVDRTDDLKNCNNIIKFEGYYQNEKNIRPFRNEIIKLFEINDEMNNEMNDYFLHIRRGDYVGNSYHELNLNNYYKKSLDLINNNKTGLTCNVLSNDIQWCEDYDLLKDYRVNFIKNSDEIYGLNIMKNSRLGGISANSTYSWWGLYMNIERPYLIIPNRYFPHNMVHSEGYYFPECTIINI